MQPPAEKQGVISRTIKTKAAGVIEYAAIMHGRLRRGKDVCTFGDSGRSTRPFSQDVVGCAMTEQPWILRRETHRFENCSTDMLVIVGSSRLAG